MFRFLYKTFTACIALSILLGSLGTDIIDTTSAAFTDSSSITLANGTLVLFIEQTGSTYRLRNRVDSYRGSGLPQISCEVKTPDGILRQRTACSEDISYNGSNGILTIYTQLNNEQATFDYNTSTQRFSTPYHGSSNTNNNGSTTYYTTDCTTSNNACTLQLSTDDTSPDINQSVDLTARFLNNTSSSAVYRGQVRFYIYKLNSSNTYVTASNYSDYSMTNDRYTFSSSDAGYKTLYDYIYFRANGTYKVRIQDDYGRYDEETFYVGTSNCGSYCTSTNNADNFLVDINDTTPDINQSLTTYVTARNGTSTASNYYGGINFVVEYNNGGSRYTASSSDYALSPSSLTMTSSDYGYRATSSQLILYRSGLYRLKVVSQNNSNVYGYKEFYVNSSSTTTQGKRFDLTTNDDTPYVDSFVSLSVIARDTYGNRWSNYNNRVRFQVYRRAYSSDSWTDITSSSSDNSNYRIYDTSYLFSSSNNGEYYNSNFIKFYNNSYDYKVRVVDDYDSSMAGEIYFYLRNPNLGNNNNNYPYNNTYSSAYRFVGSIDPTSPRVNSAMDVIIYPKNSSNMTVTNYNNRINFEIERKTSPTSSSWNTASSSYCDLDRSSYTFSTSDNGYVKLRDLIECKRTGWYRLKITDNTNSSIYGYLYFTITSSSSLASSSNGYSSTQLRTIKSQYASFMSNVNARELANNGLAYDSARQSVWTDMYAQLYEIVYNKSDKELRDYDDYVDAIQDFNDDFYRLR